MYNETLKKITKGDVCYGYRSLRIIKRSRYYTVAVLNCIKGNFETYEEALAKFESLAATNW